MTASMTLVEKTLVAAGGSEDLYSLVLNLRYEDHDLGDPLGQPTVDAGLTAVKLATGLGTLLSSIPLPTAELALETASLLSTIKKSNDDVKNLGYVSQSNVMAIVGSVSKLVGFFALLAAGATASAPILTTVGVIAASVGVAAGVYSATLGAADKLQEGELAKTAAELVETMSTYSEFAWSSTDLEACEKLKTESPLYYPVVELMHMVSPSLNVKDAVAVTDASSSSAMLGDAGAMINFIRTHILGVGEMACGSPEQYQLALDTTHQTIKTFGEIGVCKFRPLPSSAEDILALAQTDSNLRRSLYLGWPFIVEGEVVGVTADPGEWSLFDPETNQGSLTDEWLKDRALLALALVGRNETEGTYGISPAMPGDRVLEFDWFDEKNRRQMMFGETTLPLFGAPKKPAQSIQFGSAGSDSIEGTNYQLGDHLYGGSGDDTVKSFQGDDYIEGGKGDDWLEGGSGKDTLIGNAGDDVYFFDEDYGRDEITDSDGIGAIGIDDVRLSGGTQRNHFSPNYYDISSDTTYHLFGDSLSIHREGYEGEIHVKDWTNGELDIYLVKKGQKRPGPPPGIVSPIVLDLDGNGVATRDRSAAVFFDHDANGFAESTGWVGSGDGLLARDLNGNGKIDSGRELFGSETLLSGGGKADNGFTALAQLDSNGDGKVDATDSAFSSLRVWRDQDADGRTDTGELISLTDAGVQSISLVYQSLGFTDAQGNLHAQLGSYQTTSGATLAATDVWFAKDASDSVSNEQDVAVSAAIAALPDIQADGTVRSLHQAMARDATLESLVSQFAQAETEDERSRLARDIVWRWTGASSHAADSRGQYITDARWLYMMEAFTGEPFIQAAGDNAGTPNPGPYAAAAIYKASGQIFEEMLAHLMVQTHLKGLFDQVTVSWNRSQQQFTADLGAVVDTLVSLANTDIAGGLALIAQFTRTLQALEQLTPDVASQLITGLASLGAEAVALVASPPRSAYGPEASGLAWQSGSKGSQALVGGDGTDTLLGGYGNDTLVGGKSDDELVGGDDDDWLDGGAGNDRLYGGEGADTYLFGRGAGYDTILNLDADGLNVLADRIRFGVSSTEVVAKRFGDDLILVINGSADRLTVAGYFADGATTGRAVELIEFSDGAHWDLATVKGMVLNAGGSNDLLLGTNGADVIHGLDGDDTIRAVSGSDNVWGDGGRDELSGGAGNDTLDGGGGDDILDGGQGDDTYVVTAGGGRDTVREGRDEAAGGNDTLRIQGVAPGSVKLTRDRTDIVIQLPGHLENGNLVEDSIRLQGALEIGSDTSRQIEQIVFDDGTVWTLDDLMRALTNGGAGDDQITGFATADTLTGGAGNDTLSGMLGNDTLLGQLGDDNLRGGDGDDRLEGGDGDDRLDGDGGNNTFVFGLGDGHDTLSWRWNGYGPGANTLVFKAGIDPADVYFRQANNGELLIVIDGTEDRLTVEGFFWQDQGENPLQNIQFSDGTVWDVAAINARMYEGTPGDDRINEATETDILRGGAGNDYIIASDGDNLLQGEGGNDTLYGGFGVDTLQGGLGDDLLRGATWMEGGAGDDTIEVSLDQKVVFGRGDGQDVIRGDGSSELGTTIKLGAGISAADIKLTRVYREVPNGPFHTIGGYFDLELTIAGTNDSVLIENFSPNGADGGPTSAKNPLHRIEFADGTAWDLTEICRQAGNGGNGDDVIVGFAGAETLEGGAGNDDLHGDYTNGLFNESDAETSPDLLLGQAGNDTLRGGALDTLDGGEGNDTLWGNGAAMIGGAGDDRIDGSSGDMLQRGGTGNDLLLVGLRNTVHFDRGDGQDVIVGAFTTDAQAQAAAGRLVLGSGIASADVTAAITGNEGLTLKFGSGDQINLTNYFEAQGQANNFSVTLKTVEFADQSTRLISSWLQNGTVAAEQLTGTTGNDLIAGYAGNDTLNGGNGNDGLHGGFGNDSLTGGAGDDTMAGGSGVDKLVGGTGDDVYYIDANDSVVVENANEGIDTVRLSANDCGTYVLAANVENMVLDDTYDDWGNRGGYFDAIGNSLNNRITGNQTSSRLNGGGGVDTLIGGDGDDTYVVDSTTDTITENANEGVDKLESTVTIAALAANIENLELMGTMAINGTGNALSNVLTGNEAANVLAGGAGDDTYVIDSTIDSVIEDAGAGIDTIETSVTLANLAANVENLTLVSDDSIDATGNSLDNVLTGNSEGNTLNGGTGTDTLVGGYGDDTYVVDSTTDTITEATGGGIDTLRAGVTIAALGANLENLTLTGGAAIDGTGNALDNTLTGNSAANRLAGGQGNDVYVLDSSSDTVIEAANEGTDTIRSSVTVSQLVDHVENLTLSGTDAINATGNELANVITGNSAANTLTGGLGDDTYVLDSSSDMVVEQAGEGTDTVRSSVTVSALAANVEKLVLTGSAAINGSGNALSNVLQGNEAVNTLTGGAGDDTYLLDSALDTIVEASGGGDDTVQSSVTVASLAANVENLILTGQDAIDGTGNALNNTLQGNSAVNRLAGGAGDDTYVLDSTIDVVVENVGEGIDTVASSLAVTLLATNVENLLLTGTAYNGTGNALDNTLTGNAESNWLDGAAGSDTLAGGAGHDSYIVDSAADTIVEEAGAGIDTVRASVSIAALAANVENLMLTGTGAINGGGNALNNVVTGNGAANRLDGGAGTDTLSGGNGDDVYVVDSMTDTINESNTGGTDTIESSVTLSALVANVENLTLTGAVSIDASGNSLDNRLTGNAAANMMSGGAGKDTLDGAGGDDWLSGGVGDDTYIVDSMNDYVVENDGDGLDTVLSSVTQFALAGGVEKLTLTGVAAIDGAGNTLNNTITGNAAANRLDGGSGFDMLIGGAGDDTYVIEAVDTVTEAANEGVDTVESLATVSVLATNVENLTLVGAAAVNGTGNALNNVLTGNSAANTLNGGSGTDTMSGGAGDDMYVVDLSTDVVIESAGQGVDTVQSSLTWTLAAHVDNLTLTGSTAINGTGNALDNVITGNSAANVMIGGLGNDTYVVGSTTDTVVEAVGEGVDTVQSGVTLTLAANVENLTLTGGSAINGTGNALNNLITGNAYTNVMTGGLGDDTYVVASTGDSVVENTGEGTDTILSSVTLSTLAANVENLVLTGTSAINGTGNLLNNTLTGNAMANKLDGAAGVDTLAGGGGDDTYVVDSTTDTITELVDEGTDTLQSSVTIAALIEHVENLTLTGSTAINGTGNALDNLITGNTAANVMTGGLGNDTYVVGSTADTVIEGSGEGTDTVQTNVTLGALAANVENLTLTGGSAINGTGNTLGNVLTGNTNANILDGGTGVDTLVGGMGNDIYVVDSSTDTITESAGEGTDTLQSSVTVGVLVANVENLTLTGASAIHGTGNTLNNVLTGNSAVNVLTGGLGDDTYVLDASADTVVENDGEGVDTIQSNVTVAALVTNVENLTLSGSGAINGTGNALDNLITGNSAANVMTGRQGNDTYVVGSTTDTVVEVAGEGVDTIQTSVTLTALAANVENLRLTSTGAINGTGNALDNVITGNTGANQLNGAAGTDTLVGGTGDDVYVVDTATDTLIELASQGTDTVQSSVTIALAANIEKLTLTGAAAINGTGNELANTLTGNTAANTLLGGLGDDTYVLDSTLDTVVEGAGDGNDTIQTSVTQAALAANVENLTLTGTNAINGTGNALNNLITGNSAANVMTGGLGDDVYVVASTSDSVVEAAGEGNDTIQSSVTLTLAANVENLTLTGSTAINGTGNALNNLITGNSLANVMTGGLGDDTYVVASTTDSVVENAGEGVDTVQSSVTLTLAANVENLTLTGGSGLNGTGNALSNVLTGNSGINVLTGGSGDDTYVVQSTGDSVVENGGEGTDAIQTSVTLASLANNVENLLLLGTAAINATGNALNNLLTGNAASNVFNGGAGTDTLVGGDGDDTYQVDTATDAIVEADGEGTDVIQSSVTIAVLAANVENLTLTGTAAINATGNILANLLTGNTGANTLAGGLGDDVYVVDAADAVVEDADAGIDTIKSSATVTALVAHVENIILTGGGQINATGNALDNVITAGSGSNVLTGGLGNDTYVAVELGDTVVEGALEGIDTVQTRLDYTLGANVENLQIINTLAVDGTGNALNNLLTGNSAANILKGEAGDDTIDGAAGADQLLGGTGNDTYQFALGSGTDEISENDATAGTSDWVEFGAGVNRADVTVYRHGDDLRIAVNGSSDTLTLVDWFLGNRYHVENFRWADGSVSTAVEMERWAIQTVQSTPDAQTSSMSQLTLTEDLWLNPMQSQALKTGASPAPSQQLLTPQMVRWHDVERAVALSSVSGTSEGLTVGGGHDVSGMVLTGTDADARQHVGEAGRGGRWTDPERLRQTIGGVL